MSMNKDDKETLSQLMDGEWQDLNAAQSVEAACADDELKSTWSRYHLIRDVIRNDEISIDTSLSARISQAIEDEPTYTNVSAISASSGANSDAAINELNDSEKNTNAQQPNAQQPSVRQPSAWKAGFGGFAVAASMALATVVGLNLWQSAPNSGIATQSVASSSAVILPGVVLPEVEYVSNKGTFWVTPAAKRSAVSEQRLNAMLSAHIERSPTAERSGMLPYSRLVGYDSVTSE